MRLASSSWDGHVGGDLAMGTVGLSSNVNTTGSRKAGQVGSDPRVPGLEPGANGPDGTFLFVKHPNEGELVAIHGLAAREISDRVANLDIIRSVFAHNPD